MCRGNQLIAGTKTLQQAIDYEPTHVSTYGLTFEKGTSFWSRRNKGELQQISDELELQMYQAAMNQLEENGFEQYEISSFAKDGYRSLHNQVYWTGQPFWSFGPGAASYVNGVRSTNHRSLFTWMKRLKNNESPVADVEELSAEDRARELLVLGLRRCEGVEQKWFESRTGYELKNLIGNSLDDAMEWGDVVWENNRICITPQGRAVADSIVVALL